MCTTTTTRNRPACQPPAAAAPLLLSAHRTHPTHTPRAHTLCAQVSPTYAAEVGGNPILASHGHKFHGIRNGIDPELWDPENNRWLPLGYTADNVVRGWAGRGWGWAGAGLGWGGGGELVARPLAALHCPKPLQGAVALGRPRLGLWLGPGRPRAASCGVWCIRSAARRWGPAGGQRAATEGAGALPRALACLTPTPPSPPRTHPRWRASRRPSGGCRSSSTCRGTTSCWWAWSAG
jgi:hypothetical protein